MEGLKTFYGNVVSEHADRTLDLVGTGWLVAMSTHRDMNALAAARYVPEFGKSRVLRLRLLSAGEAKRPSDRLLTGR